MADVNVTEARLRRPARPSPPIVAGIPGAIAKSAPRARPLIKPQIPRTRLYIMVAVLVLWIGAVLMLMSAFANNKGVVKFVESLAEVFLPGPHYFLVLRGWFWTRYRN